MTPALNTLDEHRLLTAGVDEAGRGPLAGPVVAAAVVLNAREPIQGLADSKLLSAARREALTVEIKARAIAWAVGRAEVGEIDRINILQASLLAMRRAVLALPVDQIRVVVDGNRCPTLPYPVQAVVRGDRTVPAISAASILAKVTRDHEMVELDRCYPGYGFAKHKGYPTSYHLEALTRRGVTPQHRRSFRPVRELIDLDRKVDG